jgi:hypothetical protein
MAASTDGTLCGSAAEVLWANSAKIPPAAKINSKIAVRRSVLLTCGLAFIRKAYVTRSFMTPGFPLRKT